MATSCSWAVLAVAAALGTMAACSGSSVKFVGTDGGGGAGGGTPTTTSTTSTVITTTPSNTTTVPGCVHTVCQVGDPLVSGCSECVTEVCEADAYCCEQAWDNQCIGEADTTCGSGCCGNGECEDQTCDACPADCGECVCGDGKCEGEDCESCPDDCGVCPECPHEVCVAGDALSTTACRAGCVEEVCKQDEKCCGEGQNSGWTVPCQKIALALCKADPCVEQVCAQDADCCSSGWDKDCVAAAKQACQSACNCAHPVCEGGDPLAKDCSPCAHQICLTDPYCCETSWDGLCVAEVASVCAVICPPPEG